MTHPNPIESNASPSASVAAANRRERRTAETRERLFRAALQRFTEKGFAETTVEDITNAADLGKGTFFNYFPSKEHILIAFSDMQLAKLQAAVATAAESKQSMPEFLSALTVRMTEEPARAPDVVRAILQANLANSSVRTAMRENHLRSQSLLTRLITLGQDRGEFRADMPASDLALVLRQTIFGTLLMWSVYGDVPLAERIRMALHVLWAGLAPRQQAGPAHHESGENLR